MLAVIDQDASWRFLDEPPRCHPFMTGFGVVNADRIGIDAIAALLQGKLPVPSIKVANAGAMSCYRLDNARFIVGRLAYRATEQMQRAVIADVRVPARSRRPVRIGRQKTHRDGRWSADSGSAGSMPLQRAGGGSMLPNLVRGK